MSVLPGPVPWMGCLLLASAFFSASETALFSLGTEEVPALRGLPGGNSLHWCLRRPRPVLLSILLANLFLNTLYFSLAGSWAIELGAVDGTAVSLGALLILVLCGEVVPKALALGFRGRLAVAVSPFLRIWTLLLSPLRIPITLLLDRLSSRVVAEAEIVPGDLTPAELQEIVHRHPERFGLERRVADLLGELVGWASFQVRDLMRPYVDLKPVDAGARASEIWKTALEGGDEWVPVERDGVCIGLLDLRRLPAAGPETSVGDLVESLPVIPETARLHHLVEQWREAKGESFLVVDEYGHVVGIIGWKELVHDAVGDIARGEQGEEPSPVKLRAGRGWEVDGALNLKAFEETFGLRLEAEKSRTLGGWIVERLGTFPSGGERIDFEGHGFEVLGVRRGRVMKVLVRLPENRVEGAGNGASDRGGERS